MHKIRGKIQGVLSFGAALLEWDGFFFFFFFKGMDHRLEEDSGMCRKGRRRIFFSGGEAWVYEMNKTIRNVWLEKTQLRFPSSARTIQFFRTICVGLSSSKDSRSLQGSPGSSVLSPIRSVGSYIRAACGHFCNTSWKNRTQRWECELGLCCRLLGSHLIPWFMSSLSIGGKGGGEEKRKRTEWR